MYICKLDETKIILHEFKKIYLINKNIYINKLRHN